MRHPSSLRIFTAAAILAFQGCRVASHDRMAVRASMNDSSGSILEFYASQSPTTDPLEYTPLLDEIPGDPEGIVRVVQNLLIRADVAESVSGIASRRRIRREINVPTVRQMMRRITDLDARPLTATRDSCRRFVAICAHYAMLTTAMLRNLGIPARARGGFETWVSETKHHDHWIAEYWNDEAARWTRIDAEIELEQPPGSTAPFNALDVPAAAFVTGAEAWTRCRRGEENPDHFGVRGDGWYGGWDFVLNELLLDFNALNRVESLPWDSTPMSASGYDGLSESDRALLDEVAQAVLGSDGDLEPARRLFGTHADLRKAE